MSIGHFVLLIALGDLRDMSSGLTTTKKQLLEALKLTGDKPEDLVCFYQPIQYDDDGFIEGYGDVVQCTFDQLPERPFCSGYGRPEGEPCIAFSPRYVYIKVQYDGAEWFEAIPRHPEYVTKPIPWPGAD